MTRQIGVSSLICALIAVLPERAGTLKSAHAAPRAQGARTMKFMPEHRWHRRGIRRKALAVAASVAALATVAAGCASTGASSTGGTPISGGTAVFAEPPSTTPNYIFPYVSSAYISDINIFDLQSLLYRPLYWFGQGSQPVLNTSLSLADPPTFNGTKVTIKLKHYMWSNGTPVTAQNVVFWLNMEQAEPSNYGAYTGFPANVKDITVVSPTELTMVMDKSYNTTWFLYNDLSQITPMPDAWDATASGPSQCATTVSDCTAVYTYLDSQSKNMSGYVGSPLWSVVDGPWTLSSFNADGHLSFVPNKSYSGPTKPKLSVFEEVPFTTDTAEYNVLQSPSSATKIDVGYIPQQDVPSRPANAAVGPNPLAAKGYTLAPWQVWGINYFPVNFQSTTGNGPIIRQLYFRQVLENLMNQPAVVSGPLRGYGAPTVGPVGTTPSTQWLSPQGKSKQGDPFPFSPSQAKSLLTSHGWTVNPGGVSTCSNPAECGPGIKQGQGLSFTLPYATGLQWVQSEMTQLQSNAAAVGIKLNLDPKPFNQVTAMAGGNCVVAKLPCNWDMADWGGGWSFAPDYEPTGEELFMTGDPANSGGYSNPANDNMISQTLTSSNLQYMYSWQDYLSSQLPFIWQPQDDYQLTEIANNLRGVTPQSTTLSINPENWYFTK
jgi:peptide/nickel transport system substrate-binding protein